MRFIPENGQGFMEYSILIVLIAVLVMGVLILMGPGTVDMYSYIHASF
jgi:Flp pilus assembly pilin Flp